MTTKTGAVGVLTLFVVLLSFGCKSRNPNAPASVSGKITLNGAPITAGTITFGSADKGGATVTIGPDGTYEATDLPTGELVVTIETESANPDTKKEEYKGGKGPPDSAKMFPGKKKPPQVEKGADSSPRPDYHKTSGTYTKIALRYANPAESKLSVNLNKGSNKKDFQLTD